MRHPIVSLVLGSLLGRPKALLRIGAWSVLEAAPAFVIGLAIARAIEDSARTAPGRASPGSPRSARSGCSRRSAPGRSCWPSPRWSSRSATAC
ncbi:hypothetical protein ACFQHO_05175 [Actinomadura yumaensis]|uniref:hypothetical protein n=1 Tax=Actinomadura yumaensis TaxID=111807 RepID=UPI00360942A3